MNKITDLREIKRLYKLIIENISDTVCITDLDFKVKYISPSVTKLSGFNLEELQSWPIDENLTPESKKKLSNILKKLLYPDILYCNKKPITAKMEIELLRKDKKSVWMEVIGKLIRDKLGIPQEILLIGRNIDERIKTEKELRKMHEFNFTLLNKSPSPIMVLNNDGSVDYFNSAFEKMTGYFLNEAKGLKPPFPWWSKEEYDRLFLNYRNLLRGTSERAEVNFQKKDGSKIFVLMDCAAITLEDNVHKYIASIIDITDKKISEGKLEYLSFHDSLTGLYNRAYFEEELKRLNKSRNIPLSLIIGDLNSLKLINDAFGHNKGDYILKKMSGILRNCCRKEDIISRWGGDEFAIILPDTCADTTDNIIGRIKTACEFESGCNENYPLSIAIGSAVKKYVGENINDIFKLAEDNMYRNKLMERKKLNRSMFLSLERLLFERNLETEEHIARLQKLAGKLGKIFRISGKQSEDLFKLVRFHDIGNIAIPENIFKKRDKFTMEEWFSIKRHPEIGSKIAESFPDIAGISDCILSHHEWWDGNGYPRKLAGEEIPFISRLISVVDAFDVMTNDSTYKTAISKGEAIKELKKFSGIQFDPDIVEEFIKIVEM